MAVVPATHFEAEKGSRHELVSPALQAPDHHLWPVQRAEGGPAFMTKSEESGSGADDLMN